MQATSPLLSETSFEWARVVGWTKEKFPFSGIHGDEIRLVMAFGDGDNALRVRVRLRQGRDSVTVLAELGEGHHLDPVSALRWNSQLPMGALALVGNAYVLWTSVAASDLSAARLERAIQAVSGGVAEIRRRERRAVDGAAFQNYAD
jgi:hypothetical protein